MANYYIDPTGNDTNNGLTPETAWLTKANTTTLTASDFVLLNRGGSWYPQSVREHGDQNVMEGVYCMGDSQTSGDYPPLLAAYLGYRYVVVDRGVGGENTTQMLARFATDITNYSDVDYVIIMGGTNDVAQFVAAATVEANLQAMYDAAKAKGAVVIAMTITPSDAIISSPTMLGIRNAVNTWIRTIPTNVDYVVDTYAAMEDPSNPNHILPAYTTDGTHYTAAGNEAVLAAIQQQATLFQRAVLSDLNTGVRAPNGKYYKNPVTGKFYIK